MLPSEKLIFPEIFSSHTNVFIATPNSKFAEIFSKLKNDEQISAEGTYGSALSLYSWIKGRVAHEYPETDYASARIHREKLQKITSRLLIKISNHQAELKGSPQLPWLKNFFPDQDHFFISFTDFLGMNGAYQWFSRGIQYPGLQILIHPFYGVYFPTRFEHLELFDKWLGNRKGEFQNAIDVGAGCGVLSFYMLKHGISQLDATDINPNAIFSLHSEITRNNLEGKINAYQGTFFADLKKQYDLIVFNPPWLPGLANDMMDQAMYYPDGFLETFITEAKNKLNPNGRLVILFSNFAFASGIIDFHPLEKALKNSAGFKLENISKQKVDLGSGKKSRHWMNKVREKEWVELWEIKVRD